MHRRRSIQYNHYKEEAAKDEVHPESRVEIPSSSSQLKISLGVAPPVVDHREVQDIHQRFADLTKDITSKLAELDDKATRWAEVEKRIESTVKEFPNIIRFDVGGQIFAVLKSDLLKYPNTYFTGLLGSGKWNPDDKDGTFFINRNAEGFPVFLDFLRDGSIDLNEIDEKILPRVKSHFDYFCVPLPEELKTPKWSRSLTDERIAIQHDGRAVTMQTDEELAFAFGEAVDPTRVRMIVSKPHSVTRWSIRVGLCSARGSGFGVCFEVDGEACRLKHNFLEQQEDELEERALDYPKFDRMKTQFIAEFRLKRSTREVTLLIDSVIVSSELFPHNPDAMPLRACAAFHCAVDYSVRLF